MIDFKIFGIVINTWFGSWTEEKMSLILGFDAWTFKPFHGINGRKIGASGVHIEFHLFKKQLNICIEKVVK